VSEYVVFTKEKTTDAEELKTYAEEIWPTFKGHEVKVLVGYGRHEIHPTATFTAGGRER
jgi:hypothetical protein